MAAQGTTVKIEMPSMGESVTEGTVLEVLVKVGDTVAVDDPLLEISTDKVDAELPSTAAGVVATILVSEDDTVTVGQTVIEIEAGDAPAASENGNGAAPSDAPSDSGDGEIVDVALPEMGDSVVEGTLLEWLVAVGDTVERDQGLAEISTDKVDAELPSPVAGTVTELIGEPDDTVSVGTVLVRIQAGAGAPSGTVSPAAKIEEAKPAAEAPSPPSNGGATNGDANATPVAARLAADKGVDTAKLTGTGPRGRVTKADVENAAAGGGSSAQANGNGAAPSAPAPPEGAESKVIRGPAATLVRFMEDSRSIPTATSFRTLSVDTLAERRGALKAGGQKLSFTHLIAWAIVRAAADDMPVMANSFAIEDGKPHRVTPVAVSLGIAVDAENKKGERTLVVPVIRDASTLSLPEFVGAFNELIAGARDGTLGADAFQGANITLTNPGGIGTVASVPRLMPGQGTIVATGSIAYPPGLEGVDADKLAELGVSKVMTMTSTYDHRVIQGAESGAFLKKVDELLQGGDGFFDSVFAALDVTTAASGAGAATSSASAASAPTGVADEALLQAVQSADSLVKAHRTQGHLAARLDPLGATPRGDPSLDPASVDLTPELMARIPASILRVFVPGRTFADALPHLAETYCGTIAYEVEHIAGPNRRMWLREAIESGTYRGTPETDERKRLLTRLSEVEALEKYLHKAFLGKKQFSIEGLDVLVPMLDEAIELTSRSGAREVVLGMAHRGRLNVLAHTVGRPYSSILVEFEGEQRIAAGTAAPEGGTGDVKYHYGARGTRKSEAGKDVTVTLAPNPSHLEYVNPVIEGSARADQTSRSGPELSHDPSVVVPVLIHGDAAFPGQGIVAETLNLQALNGYSTGGTIHIIANNQLGFTTDPLDSRSTRYASDLAKGFDLPIIHVNADDVEASVSAMRLAVAFREEFGRDVLIDLVGYRRFGHNETDEPAYTQPQMYDAIKRHPPVREVYADKLIDAGVVTKQEADTLESDSYQRVADAHAELKENIAPPPAGTIGNNREIDTTMSREPKTTLPEDTLRSLNEQILRVPDSFHVHRKLKPFLQRRRDAAEEGGRVDWAHAEALAVASLLALGVPVRLTGQDSERGTFSQRHMVLHDAEDGSRYTPLQHLQSAAAPFELHNSPLSEQACVGFEYGYSVTDPDALVMWEAQFGDFVNSAQVMIDQFLVSGLAKWGATSRLTLLLPHGYEGSGPEHSSGRVERFLQACAEGNMRVANTTTPAQYFHLLRRQALVSKARPLVLMTPKSLLRLPAATSTLPELYDGSFQRVIDDPTVEDREKVTKLVLCSGKVYYDIQGNEDRASADHIAVARVELLYPFPEDPLRELMASYPNLEHVAWVQEEPRNMGPRAYMRRRMAAILPQNLDYQYVGRQLRAAQSEGYTAAHRAEQARIVRVALDLEDDVLGSDASAERPVL